MHVLAKTNSEYSIEHYSTVIEFHGLSDAYTFLIELFYRTMHVQRTSDTHPTAAKHELSQNRTPY